MKTYYMIAKLYNVDTLNTIAVPYDTKAETQIVATLQCARQIQKEFFDTIQDKNWEIVDVIFYSTSDERLHDYYLKYSK